MGRGDVHGRWRHKRQKMFNGKRSAAHCPGYNNSSTVYWVYWQKKGQYKQKNNLLHNKKTAAALA
jgi:hypothetical protein